MPHPAPGGRFPPVVPLALAPSFFAPALADSAELVRSCVCGDREVMARETFCCNGLINC